MMKWDISDHQDQRVVDYTRWLKIENYRNLKKRAGVYVFADVNHQVKYIGKAGVRRMVDEIYDANYRRGKGKGATLVKVLYTKSADAQSLETALINKYNPPNNLT